MDPSVRLSDGRVTLEPYAAEHITALVEAVRESVAELGPWLPWCHPGYRPSDATAWVRTCAAGWTDGSGYQFAVAAPAKRFAGGLGLRVSDRQNRVASIGYWVRTSATRQGIATAAVRLAARYAFETLRLSRLEIFAMPENLPSRRVAERAGAQLECIARNRIVMRGAAHAAALYSLVPDDL
jgi:RimJ/RimL family protein N-acetyltransferase